MVFFILHVTIFAFLIFSTLGLPIPDHRGLQLKAQDHVTSSPLLPRTLQNESPMEIGPVPPSNPSNKHFNKQLKTQVVNFIKAKKWAEELTAELGTDNGFFSHVRQVTSVPEDIWNDLTITFAKRTVNTVGSAEKIAALKRWKEFWAFHKSGRRRIKDSDGTLQYRTPKTAGIASGPSKRGAAKHRSAELEEAQRSPHMARVLSTPPVQDHLSEESRAATPQALDHQVLESSKISEDALRLKNELLRPEHNRPDPNSFGNAPLDFRYREKLFDEAIKQKMDLAELESFVNDLILPQSKRFHEDFEAQYHYSITTAFEWIKEMFEEVYGMPT